MELKSQDNDVLDLMLTMNQVCEQFSRVIADFGDRQVKKGMDSDCADGNEKQKAERPKHIRDCLHVDSTWISVSRQSS